MIRARRPIKPERAEVQAIRLRRRVVEATKRNAELRAGIDMANGLAAYLGEAKRNAERKLQHVVNMLPEGSVCVDPERVPAPGLGRCERYRVDVPTQAGLVSPSSSYDDFMIATVEDVVQIAAEVHRDILSRNVHMLLVVGDQDVRYGLSASAIASMTEEQLRTLLMEHAAPLLVREAAKVLKQLRSLVPA